MTDRKKLRPFGLYLPVLLACFAPLPTHGQEETPFTRLFDTGVASAQPLKEEAISKRVGWTLVPEDNVAHQFSGDAVLLNDKLAVVLRKQGRGAEVYSRAANGLKHRATATPLSIYASATKLLDGFQIVENTSSAVLVKASVNSPRTEGLGIRLTTGEAILELRPDVVFDFVNVETKARYVVVPDYFGDDMVFAPDDPRRRYLPAENFCLSLLDGGDAIVMSVWQSREQEVLLPATEPGRNTGFCSTGIGRVQGKSLWLAFMESPGLWHAGSASAKDDWKPPFPAKWRCSLVRENSVADSWTTEKPDGTSAERSADFSPLPPGQAAVKRTEVRAPNAPFLIYPIDRSAATPLTVTCPTDVMRNTLGVGPCQYILACEGLAAQGDPTPNAVMNWVEKQFEQKKDRKVADDIKERLQVMTEHVAHARSRIQTYGEFAGQMRKSLANKRGSEPFRQIVDDLDRFVAAGLAPTATPERARQLTGEVSALIGKPDALPACHRLGEQLRSIGAVQDSTLARCRMAVRRLRAEGKTVFANQPSESDLAQEVRRLAEQILQKK